MAAKADSTRDGYRPEWLAVRSMPSPLPPHGETDSYAYPVQLEDAAGGRYVMTGDFSVDVPTYDAVFAGLSKQWPPLAEDLKVCE